MVIMLTTITIVSLLTSSVLSYSYLVRYNFGSNFGQMFYDYSGNGNHGQNGNSLSSTTFDTTPTDRGAYSDGTKYIMLPPNEKVSTSVDIGSVFSITLWYLPASNSQYYITYRSWGSYFFYVKRYVGENNISVLMQKSDYTPSEQGGGSITQGKLYLGIWNFIVIQNSGATMKFYTSSSTAAITLTQPSAYQETGTALHYIGYTSNSFYGFMWNFNIFQDSIDPSDFFVSSYTPGSCRLDDCPNSCSPGLKDDLGSFCLSIETQTNQHGGGSGCGGCSYGCSQNNCFNCNSCTLKSCEISSNSVVCVCPGGTGTATSCTCSGGSVMVGGYIECSECYGECSGCTTQYSCTDCSDSNAEPYSNYGCICKDGYYNTTALIDSGTCMMCHSECLTCSQASKCLSCKDPNADPDLNVGCVCKSFYYNDTSLINNSGCTRCNENCKTCTQDLLCTQCITNFSVPHDSVGCICDVGYYNTTSLNGPDACLSCHPECKECSTEFICSECVDLNAEPSITVGCFCSSGYYNVTRLETEGACLSCFSECKICSNASVCEQCADSNAEPQATGGCLCSAGYYNITQLNSEGSCLSCISGCKTCSNASVCEQCADSNAEPQATGGCLCSSGYYNVTQLETEGDCLNCFSECKICSNASVCEQCVDSNAEPQATGGCLCRDGFYNITQLNSEGSCLSCFSECITCSNSFICEQCADSNAEPQATGGCLCRDGFYNITQLNSEGSCLSCISECKKCSNASVCEQCVDHNAELQATGGCLCSDGFYNITQLTSENSCLSCYQECKTCSSADKCDLCYDSNSEPQDTGGCLCKSGYYNNSLLISDGLCLLESCVYPNSFETLTGECKCNEGYYSSSNTSQLICSECSEYCKTCDSSINCFSCKLSKMNIVNETCKCPENSEPTNNTCIALAGFYLDYSIDKGYFTDMCDSSCKTCSDQGYDNCTSCDSEFKLVDGQCTTCPDLCRECNESCIQCVENAELSGNNCSCIAGYEISDKKCEKKYFEATFFVLDKNYAKILFSEKTLETLSLENFNFTVKYRDDLNVKMIKTIKNTEYHFTITFSESIIKGTQINVELMQKIIYSELKSQLKDYVLVGYLESFSPIIIDPAVKVILDSTSSASKSAVSSSLGAAIVSNPSAAWTLLNMIQIIAFIPLSSAKLSNNTRIFFTAFSDYNIIPNPLLYVFSDKVTSEPYLEARQYGIETSVFTINIGSSFATFIAITIMWPLMYLLSKTKKAKIAAKAIRILGNYRFSFFLRFWTQMYLEIGIYGIVQLKSDPSKNFSAYLNLFLATFCIIVFVLTIPLLLVSTRISSTNISENSQEFLQKWGSLYNEFKNDRGYWSSQFYFIFFVRRLAFVLSQIFLNNYPYLQTALNAGFSGVVLIHLIIFRPFKEGAIMLSNFAGELCVTIVMVLCCLFVVDLKESSYEKVEIVIIFTVFSAMVIQFLISIYCFIKAMAILWRKIQKERSLNFVKNASKKIYEPQPQNI